LVRYIILVDALTIRRWEFWQKAMATRRVGDIPQVKFLSAPNQETMKMLKKCLDRLAAKGYSGQHGLALFVDWILWGFGDPLVEKYPKEINEETNEFLYKTFDLSLLMKNPHDYWGALAADFAVGKGSGFFPTPHHVVRMMTEMTMGSDKKKTRLESVCDPCAGTGRMLLEASNFSVNLFGSDISLPIVKMMKLNMWLYVPWVIRPMQDLTRKQRLKLRYRVKRLDASTGLIRVVKRKLTIKAAREYLRKHPDKGAVFYNIEIDNGS